MTSFAQTLPSYASQATLNHYRRMKTRAASRDQVAAVVSEVRKGNLRALFPNELDFSIDFQGTPVANFIDVVAHDMADGIAPLPALACVSGRM